MIQNSNKAPVPSTSSASFTDERNKSIVSNTSQVTSQLQTFTSQLVSLAQNQGSSVQQNRGAAQIPTTPKPSEGPSSSGLSSASSSSPPDYHSQARSCLFFKKCDACKQRNIDSLPSTYSVKNSVPLMAAQQHKQVKREAMNASGVNHFRMSHHNTDK